jgi:hypothetical protein
MVPLEQFDSNPENRHVPPAEVLTRRMDGEFRRNLSVIWDSLLSAMAPGDTDLRVAFEGRIRYVVRWLDRMAHLARGAQSAPSDDLRVHLNRAIDGAVAAIRALEPSRLRRRTPFHLFERSRGELVYAAFVVVECAIAELAEQIAPLDPSLPEKLLNPEPMPAFPQGDALLKGTDEAAVKEY